MGLTFTPLFEERNQNSQIYEIDGDDVNRYIEWFLNECSSISKAILKQKDIRKAKKFTCWQTGTKEFTYDLIRGGVREPVSYKFGDWGIVKIFEYLMSETNSVAVFEDILFKPSDKEIKEPNVPLAKHGNKVFYWIDHGRCTLKSVIAAYDSTRSGFTSNCILTHFDRAIEGNLDVISKADIALLAENCRQLIIDAYDGQGSIQICF